MGTLKVSESVYWTGILDPDLKKFDIILDTKSGSTYNSYLIKGNDKIALVDTAKHGFKKEYFSNLKSLVPDLTTIDYLIVNHTEPDHSGLISDLLEEVPDITILASKTAINFLKALLNIDFKYIEVDDNTKLSLGDLNLSFFRVPLLHWPDTMFTYLEEENILFSCDAFGAHYCNEKMFNDLCPDYKDDATYYFDMIVRPFKRNVLNAINKVVSSKIEIKTICPSHGPILRNNPLEMVNLYAEWSQPLVDKKDKTILIMYLSAHGNTENIAKKLMTSFPKEKMKLLNIMESNMTEIRDELEKAKVLLVGSPTVLGDVPYPMWEALAHIATVPKGIKIASAFGSFGWSGEAVPKILDRLKSLSLKVHEPGLKVNFTPSSEENKQTQDFANNILQLVNA
jgi:NADH oxidase (H2O-forming)